MTGRAKHRNTLFICALLALVFTDRTVATSYHVSMNGNDKSPGTQQQPFQTVNKGIAAASKGDTVFVHAGVYAGGISVSKSGSPGKPIILKSLDDGEVRILGRMDCKTGFRLCEATKFTYEVEDPGPIAAVAVDLDTTALVLDGLERVNSVDEVEAGNHRWFHDRRSGKLYVRYATENPEKEHTIHVLRDPQGISITGSHVVIDGFTLVGFAHSGIYLEGCRDVSVRNCTAALCGHAWGGAFNLHQTESARFSDCIAYRVMNGFLLNDARHTEITHCTVYGTRAHGVILHIGSDNSIRDTILFAGGRSGSALYVYKNAVAGLRLDYNCYLDYATSSLIHYCGTAFPTFRDYRKAVGDQDLHSINDDPAFLSTEWDKEDFRLRRNSPCRNRASDGKDMGARPSGR